MQEQQTKAELQEQLQFNNLETVVEIGDNLPHEFVTYEETDCELEVSSTVVRSISNKLLIYSNLNFCIIYYFIIVYSYLNIITIQRSFRQRI